MLNTGQLLQNRYRIDAPLGQGGMGAVYRAFDLRLQTGCVVKELLIDPGMSQNRSEAAAQFWQEAQALSHLNHPSLPRVIDYFEEGTSYCLVMDYIVGQRLDTLINAGLPEQAVLNYADQLLDVLAYIHRQGILHRDIKPQNIIVQPDGRPMLVDFGLVKNVSTGNARTKTFLQGIGTLEYAPPEQFGGGTDQRSDIYSLGATLYHALTGQAPPSVTAQMSGVKLPALRNLNGKVSPNTERVILKALSLDRNNRFADAQSMRAALRSEMPANSTRRIDGATSRPNRVVTALILAILVLLAGSVVLLGFHFFGPPATDTFTSTPSVEPKSTVTLDITSQPEATAAATIPPAPTKPKPPTVEPPSPIPPPTTPAPVPAAQRVVFARGSPDCAWVIVRDVSSGAETTFNTSGDSTDPTWSPDGTQFTAASGSCNAQDHAIAVYTLQSPAADIIVSGGNNIDPFWGSDGRIHFCKGPKTGGDLYSVDPRTRNLQPLGMSGRQPALSPDGQTLAFMALDGKNWRIWVARSNGAGGFEQPAPVPFSNNVPNGLHARMPNWTSDSARVIFNVTDNQFNSLALASVDLTTGQENTSYLTMSGGTLARPACGRIEHSCIANGSDHGLWLLTEIQGSFVTPKQISDGQDWGADIYP
jgi:eukaryotic-like serine/threonine-protein kinase